MDEVVASHHSKFDEESRLSEVAASQNGHFQLETGIDQVADYIRRWGGCSSIALFDPECQLFTVEGIEGAIGYREGHGCLVALGEPLCAEKDLGALTGAFYHYAHDKKKRIIYATVAQSFTDWAVDHGSKAHIHIGDELILDPLTSLPQGNEGRLVRQKAKQAQNAGVLVEEYTSDNPELQQAIERVGQEWVKARRGPQIYLSHVSLFDTHVGKRWFYAKQGEKIVGAVLLNRLDRDKGWLLNLLMVTPEAERGTTELLVVETLRTLGLEGCRFVSVGMTTRSHLGQIFGFGSLLTHFIPFIYSIAKKIFGLDRRRKYWEKFQPHTQPAYLLFHHRHIGPGEIGGLIRAFNVGFR